MSKNEENGLWLGMVIIAVCLSVFWGGVGYVIGCVTC